MNDKFIKSLRNTLLFIAILVSTLGSIYMYFKDEKMIAFCFLVSTILLSINLKK